jgi:large subunit ribosomal protein L5
MSAQKAVHAQNPMRTIRVEKITLNFGSGKDQKQLEKGAQLLKMITGIEPVKTITQKRIPSWGLRPGLPVGCKVTVRGSGATDICRRLLTARDFKLRRTNVDGNGNVSFGLKEYIDIPGVRYDPAIGIIGLECTLTLVRPGYRVRDRKLRKGPVARRHRVSQDEGIAFMKATFNAVFDEEEE